MARKTRLVQTNLSTSEYIAFRAICKRANLSGAAMLRRMIEVHAKIEAELARAADTAALEGARKVAA